MREKPITISKRVFLVLFYYCRIIKTKTTYCSSIKSIHINVVNITTQDSILTSVSSLRNSIHSQKTCFTCRSTSSTSGILLHLTDGTFNSGNASWDITHKMKPYTNLVYVLFSLLQGFLHLSPFLNLCFALLYSFYSLPQVLFYIKVNCLNFKKSELWNF